MTTAESDGYISVYCNGGSGSSVVVDIYGSQGELYYTTVFLKGTEGSLSTYIKKGMRFKYRSQPTAGSNANFRPFS